MKRCIVLVVCAWGMISLLATESRSQVPRIDSVSPGFARAGTAVTLRGTGFNPTNSVVYFGGAQATVVAGGSSTALPVIVPIGATYEPVTVTSLGSNLTGYSKVPFRILYAMRQGRDSIRFNTRADIFGIGRALALGEYDTDRNLDIAVATTDPSKGIGIYRNQSRPDTIIFPEPRVVREVTGGGSVGPIGRGDFDGDGKLDLALLGDVASDSLFGVWIFRNDGSGTTISFTLRDSIPLFGRNISDISVNDFNGDGRPDIAVVVDTILHLCKNNGARFDTSRRWVPLSERTGSRLINSVATGDLNGDGIVDFVIPISGENSIAVYKNRGLEGVPFPPILFPTSRNPLGVRLADLDGDGDLDVAVNSGGSDTIAILMNIGLQGGPNIVLDSARRFTMVPRLGTRIEFGDLNGDGKPEIIAGENSSAKIAYVQNLSVNNAPAFSGPYILPFPTAPVQANYFRVGDIDKDGRPDLIASGVNDPLGQGQSIVIRNTTTALVPRFRSDAVQVRFDTTVARDSTRTIRLTVTNVGSSDLTISSIQVSPPFSITPSQPPPIPFLGSRTFDVTFTPTAAGNVAGQIVFVHNDSLRGGRDTIPVSGYGRLPAPRNLQADVVARQIRWDAVNVPGFLRYRIFADTLQNPTRQRDSTTSTSRAFEQLGLLANTQYYFRVRAVDTFGVASNTSNEAAGTFRYGTFTLRTSDPLDFGSVVRGRDSIRLAIVKNTGSDTLRISSAQSNNTKFSVVSPTTPIRLAPNDSIPYSIRFTLDTTLSSLGLQNGRITFNHDVPPTFQNSFAVIGRGILPRPDSLAAVGFPDNGIQLQWRAPLQSGVRRYLIYAYQTPNPPPTPFDSTAGTETSRITLRLNPGFVYNFRVTARDVANGESDFSNQVTAIIRGQVTRVGNLSASRDTAGRTVTITGSGFNSDRTQNAVYFGGVKADVTSASPISLNVTVPVGATYEPITVTNLQTQLTGYSNVPFQNLYAMRTDRDSIRFNARADSVGGGRTLALGEFDIDRNLDIVFTRQNPDLGLVYRNRSRLDTVRFASPVNVSLPSAVGLIGRGDFNGDGKLDLAMLTASSIRIFQNGYSDTTIAFTPTESMRLLGGNIRDVAVNDFDGDGKPDIAVAFEDSIQFFKNNGANFDTTVRRWIPLSNRPSPRGIYSVATGDLNGDGIVDFVLPVASRDSIVVYKNRGLDSSGFPAPVLFRTSPGPTEVRLADIDGDGDLDVAVNSGGSGVITILMNTRTQGDAIVLGNPIFFNMAPNPRLGYMAFGDLNGDGKPEILAFDSLRIAYFQNLSTTDRADFSGPYYLVLPNNNSGVAIRAGDIDKDGRPDIVAVGIRDGNSFGQSVVFRNTTTPVAPRFRGSPAQIPFGNVVRDTPRDISFTVLNEGIMPLNVSASVTQSSQFSITPTNPPPIGELGTQVFTVRFNPTVVGADSATIIFTHNDVTHNFRDVLRVSGYGQLPAPQLQTPQIRDTLQGNVVVRWTTVSGTARYKITYGITNPPVSDTASTTADSLRINNLLTDSTYYFRVQAIDNFGAPSFFSNTTSIFIPPPSFPFLRVVGATSLNFDTVVIGSSNTRNVVVRNTGLTPLTITSASIVNSDSFSVSPTSSPPLNYRDTQTFTVRFVPRHPGRANINASLSFQHNGQGANSIPLRAVGRLSAPQNFRVVDRISGFMAVVVAWDTLRLGGVRRYVTYRGLDPTNMERRSSVTTTRDTLGAETGTLYYYRVSAEDTAFGEGVRSPADTATSLAQLQLPMPTGVTNPPGTLPPPISFFWNPVPGFGVRYQMQVRLSQTDTTTIVVDTSSVDTTFARFSQLAYNTTYYWRIRASAPGRQASAWGEASQPFPTAAAKPLDIPAYNFSDSPSQTEYKLVGVPGQNALTFGELVQGTPKVDFKLYRELGDPSRNDFQFVDNLFEGLETGRGYWLLRKGSVAAKTKPSITMPSVLTDRAVTIQKTRPWSIIANPFDGVDIRLQDLRAVNPSIANSEQLWDFTPEGWRPRDTLKPFKGYYLYDSSSTLKIPFPFPYPPRTEAPTQPFDWKIQMQLSAGGSVDRENFVGIAPAASVNRDSLESRKPPLVFDNAYLYFARPEWDSHYSLFSEDYRPALGEGQVWNFEVSKPTKTDAQIVFRGLQTIPKEYEVALVNEANTIPARLREDSVYNFTIVKPKMSFKFIVGTKEFVENELSKLLPTEFALSQNYPNPFNPSTSIAYALAKKSRVRLEIYNLLGQLVRTLVNDEQERAFYTIVWNGTNQQNLQVATGIYFYRLIVNNSPFATKKMQLLK